MSAKAAEDHKRAADHHALAARHHTETARFYDAGNHEKAAHHAQMAFAHSLLAIDCAEQAAKEHAETHGSK